MKCAVFFADHGTEESFMKLRTSRTEDRDLCKWIERALDDIERNCNCGVQIPKRLFPKKYRNLGSLWKYDLPNAWRLLYTVKGNQASIIAVVLEWLPHKKYERLFKY